MEKSNDQFVTYKWLFATGISIILITLGFIYFISGNLNNALEAKADIKWVEQRANLNSARIDVLCGQLDKMETKQDKMLTDLYEIKGLIKSNKKP